MRNPFVFSLLLILTCSQQLFSQAFILAKAPYNAPTTTQLRAPSGTTLHAYLRACLLLTPGDLADIPAGTPIKQLGWALQWGVTAPAGGMIRIYLQNTPDASFQKNTNWATAITGMTEVHYGNYSIPVVAGSANIILNLDAPFTYTGGGLYIAYDYQATTFSSTAATYYANNDMSPGCMSANSGSTPPITLGITAFRPQMLLGYDNPYTNDMAVSQLKTTQLFSPGLGGPNKVTAMVVNKGSQDQTNIPVALHISGAAYNGSLSANIPSLKAGDSTTVGFTIPPTFVTGDLTMEAAVNNDERNGNNNKQITQTIVCDELRYSGETSTPGGGVGLNTGAGIIAAKHQSPATAITVSSIKLRLSDFAGNIGNNIKGVLLNESGAILGSSSDLTITASNNDTELLIPLSTPVTIPASSSFYAGILQNATSTGFFPIGTTSPAKTEPDKYFTFGITGGVPAPITTDLGQMMIGFAGQPVAELTVLQTGPIKQGQKNYYTASSGFSKYTFKVNNTILQSSSSNVFIYAPNNNDIISVIVSQGACSYEAKNTITAQVTEIVPTAGIVYVKKGASGNGSSWANAAGELADVLLAARVNTAITQVWVAGGTYLPLYSSHDGDQGQSHGRWNSFVVTGNLKIYGGFAGTETALNQRNTGLTANKTILSGDLDGNDNPNGTIVGNNAYNIVFVAGSGSPVLDGLTITGGKAEVGAGTRSINGISVNAYYGAGMNMRGSSLQLNNMIIQGNSAVNSAGGGIYHLEGHLTISNSIIAGNTAISGAGIYNNSSDLVLINSTVSGNSASNGGAIYNSLSTVAITNSIIYGNTTGIAGNATVYYSILQDNITGTGNSIDDPLFMNMPSASSAPFIGGDYTLQMNSPAINKGDNSSLVTLSDIAQTYDLAGNPRIVNWPGSGIVDIGAYEYPRQTQTITTADLNKVYGDAAFEPGATATSGLTVSYASSDNNIAEPFQDAADNNKWKIKVKRAGTATITASQSGNANWFPAPDKTFELTVATKPVTVQLTSTTISKLYDGTANGTLTPANLEIAAGNIINGDDLQLSISSTSFTYDNKNAGVNKQITFPLSAISLGGTSAGNYNIGNVTALTANTGIITPATLTVTATAQTKVYGESDPALTYTYNGFVSGDAATFTGSLNRNPGENAGNYAILQNNLSAGSNYSIQYTGSNLTITKATQTITWVQDLVTGCDGVAPIILNASSSSGLTITYQVTNSNIATVNGQTLTPVHEGATTITATQAGDANHEAATAVVRTFSYQLSSGLRQHFADALFFDNTGGNYVQWQWYKNGTLIAGVATPYYGEATALNGTYYVTATDKNGNIVQTCPVTLSGSGTTANSIKVSPNPARTGSTVSITCNYSETVLQGANLQISNVNGTVVQRITTVRPVNSVVLPATGGLYMITLTLANGQKATVNVLVN